MKELMDKLLDKCDESNWDEYGLLIFFSQGFELGIEFESSERDKFRVYLTDGETTIDLVEALLDYEDEDMIWRNVPLDALNAEVFNGIEHYEFMDLYNG